MSWIQKNKSNNKHCMHAVYYFLELFTIQELIKRVMFFDAIFHNVLLALEITEHEDFLLTVPSETMRVTVE